MTYVTSEPTQQLADAFRRLEVDQQLALFWFVYTEMGQSITPAAPAASTVSPQIAEGLFNQVQDMSQEDQLQIQRDLIMGQNTLISREYGALSDTTKLLFWYLLAQGMEEGSVIPMPEDYQMSAEAQGIFDQIVGLEFNQQITLFRNIVSPMGVDPISAPQDSQSHL